jgi:glycosyltransferase involved in cell wall biosynthesis
MQISCSTISVVIASLNEEQGIGPTLEELQKVLNDPYLLVIDGNSADKTVEIAKNMGADVSLQDGKGKGNALCQGIKQLGPGVRYVVFTDADYTYPAEYIPKMVEVLDQDPGVGMVIGDRFKGSLDFGKSVTNPFYLGNRLIALVQHVLNGIKLNDPLSGLRVVRADVLKSWKPKSKGFDIEAEINFVVERKGYRIVEIPIDYRSRLGEKKLKVRHGFGILKRIIAESFTV